MSDTDATARFTVLAREVALPLRRYVARRVDPASVDDVVSDVFLVLWRRLSDVPAEDPLPWTYAVARGCLANRRRSAARHLRLVDRLARSRTKSPSPGEGPGEHADVHAALAGLRELDREIVMLWAWEGLPPKEIAAVTGLTANAVSIRLHRAKKELARRIGKTGPIGGQIPDEERRPR
ncbi:sigma-70 family RNA polymerase sigma factor [Intrasporangium calvum]|uniref:Sigma-70 family RNA polymerase sigma factor n=1 Tax=Intrasporangium calvum TaxID=53358 RepID=A0ABT5GEB9_9MICO|nr:sigma-70 family RNA polymerase sigma factor [Intrasporangium calvum]MDC5696559.1 sigma-70 family RNA polymerase sigma factor [Intrasporangium calvum]